MILILADAFDTHANVVEKHISDLGAKAYRLNLDVHSLQNTKLHFDTDNWHIQQGLVEFKASEIRSVWPRRLTMSLTLEQQTEPEGASFRLWRSEWNRCLYGMYSFLRDCYWLNKIQNSNLADNKYYQFDIARSIGFEIPETISSNDSILLKNFCKKGETAIKFMTQDIYKDESGGFSGIYVNKISEPDLEHFGDDSENPITLQRYIDKDYEVRHTFVSGTHFSCRIDSQRSMRANIDWRRYDVANTPHSIIQPPKQILTKIEAVMNRLGLSYGAFDFIVDKQGCWWYLEVNSAGQWLWIEDLLGLPISRKIATALIEKQ